MVSFFGLLYAQRDLVGDGDTVAFQGDNFFGVIGQHTYIFEAQVNQDLRADTAFMLHKALARGRAVELAARVNMNLRKRAGFARGFDAEAPPGVVQIEKNAAIFFGDGRKRTGDQFVAVASSG